MNKIPGYLTNVEELVLSELASQKNFGGAVAVEIGSLCGKSSSIIAKAINLGSVHCVDPWWGDDCSVPNLPVEVASSRGWPTPGTKNTLEFFLSNTQDCPNITAHRGLSPKNIKHLDLRPDFFFLDALHANPSDRDNIDYWLPKMKSGGIFCGHDYYPQGKVWPDVRTNVLFLETLLNKPVINPRNTSLWYFICD